MGKQGGRPSNDYLSLFVELRRRYSGIPQSKTISMIMQENPDLSGQIKTLQNKSRELFDESFGKVLVREGILLPSDSLNHDAHAKEALDAMLADLSDIYSNIMSKPATIGEIASRHPEYEELLKSFTKHAKSLYGDTPVRHLKKLGIIKGASEQDENDVRELLLKLARRYARLPNDNKPSTLKELIDENLLLEQHLLRAQREWDSSNGLTFVESLRDVGILGWSKSGLRKREQMLQSRCVRNATIDELRRLWLLRGMPSVFFGNSGIVMPWNVLAVDIEAGEVLLTRLNTLIRNEPIADVRQIEDSMDYRLSHESYDWSRSRLAQYACRSIVNSMTVNMDPGPGVRVMAKWFIQYETRYIEPLSGGILLYMLYYNGLIEARDLRGGDLWRAQLGEHTEEFPWER